MRLGFELWRLWNGFPPAMRDGPAEVGTSGEKTKAKPKSASSKAKKGEE